MGTLGDPGFGDPPTGGVGVEPTLFAGISGVVGGAEETGAPEPASAPSEDLPDVQPPATPTSRSRHESRA